jgi:hypothetical protein
MDVREPASTALASRTPALLRKSCEKTGDLFAAWLVLLFDFFSTLSQSKTENHRNSWG